MQGLLVASPTNAPAGPSHPAAEPSTFGLQAIIGRSRALREAVRLAERMAASRTTILLVGPTGSGKELFARGIHYAGVTARDPFVVVNCAAIPETLLESELFGVEGYGGGPFPAARRGLVELAGAGTLFLDEISATPAVLQPKLLRLLEGRQFRRLGGEAEIEVACRIIAASNVSLEDAVERGEFREDLFYRLNVYRLNLPRLGEREDDAELLARHFLERIAAERGGEPLRLSGEAVAALRMHAWPGNVRELKNVVERAAMLCEGRTIGAEHLMIQRRTSHPATSGVASAAAEIRIPPGGKTLAEIEREAVLLTLEMVRGNQSAAARILGISRPTLARKLKGEDDATSPADPDA